VPDLEFVGGRRDGEHHHVGRWTDKVPVPQVKPVIWSAVGSELTDTFSTWYTYYRKVPTPARDRHVMRLDGTPWPERFDTEAWPRRAFPYRQEWTRLRPWVWRGTGVTDDVPTLADMPVRRALYQDSWTYTIGVPAVEQFTAVRQEIDRAAVDIGETERLWHALAEQETDEDRFVRHLQREADYLALPACPAPKCTGRADTILTATTYVQPIWVEQENPIPRKGESLTAAGYVEPGRELAMCVGHASEELKRCNPYGGYTMIGNGPGYGLTPWHSQVKSALPDR
jgi:hypothetical protein